MILSLSCLSQPQHPPVFGDEFVAMTKDVLGERYRLLPYLYTLFYQAHIDSSTSSGHF